MKLNLKKIIVFVALTAIIILPNLVLASPAFDNLKTVGEGGSDAPFQQSEAGKNDIAGIIGTAIEAFIGVLGMIFLVYMLYAGYNWMIAQGDEEKVSKAKETIQRAIIGLIVCIGAYAITYFVVGKLITNGNIIK